MKNKIFLIFIALAMIQIGFSSKMILDSQEVITNGKEFKFKTIPIDPFDPFRGKYIVLNYEIESYVNKNDRLQKGDVFVQLENDSSGFAKINKVSNFESDMDNSDYFKAEIKYIYNKEKVRINFPFDRFYMDEFKAKPAEDLVRMTRRDSTTTTYAKVTVSKGKARITDVFINDESIIDVLEQSMIH